jgi:hypothetical protein
LPPAFHVSTPLVEVMRNALVAETSRPNRLPDL